MSQRWQLSNPKGDWLPIPMRDYETPLWHDVKNEESVTHPHEGL